MVEITRSNFNDIFPLVEKSIRHSTFIAIDSEFSGLTLGPSNENSLFDNLHERYEKLRSRATSFIPCQIGLATYTKHLDENSYFVEVFVFYIRPCMVGSVNRIFMFQASALDFLSGYNFDFQKFIQDGIPFINENEEVQVRQELEDGSISFPHEKSRDLRCLEPINDKINELLLKERRIKERKLPAASAEKAIIPIDKKSHVYFQLCEIRRKFPKLWAYVENDQIVVKSVSFEEKERLKEVKAVEQERILDDFVGFTKVFRLLKECQKPIIGHNLLMDLMLFYEYFHQNLPNSYDEFKEELHNIFPVIYDTKHMWRTVTSNRKFKKFTSYSNLTSLYELLKNPPHYLSPLYSPSIVPVNCKKYCEGDFVHDSGYDAFITGFVFIKISHILACEKYHSSASVRPQTLKQHLDAISTLKNKINFPYFKMTYINLHGIDHFGPGPGYLYICHKAWNRTLSSEELRNYFINYNALEFKFIKRQRAVIAAVPSVPMRSRILKDFKDNPDLLVEEYKFMKHSPCVSPTVWLAVAAFGGLLGVWIWKSR